MGIGATNNSTGTSSTTTENVDQSSGVEDSGVSANQAASSETAAGVGSDISSAYVDDGSSTDYNTSDVSASSPDDSPDSSISDDKGNTWKTFEDLAKAAKNGNQAALDQLALQTPILVPVPEAPLPQDTSFADNHEEGHLKEADEATYQHELYRAQVSNRTMAKTLRDQAKALPADNPLHEMLQNKAGHFDRLVREQENQLQQRLSDKANDFAKKYNTFVDPKAQKMVLAQAKGKPFLVRNAATATVAKKDASVLENQKKEALKNQKEAQKVAQKNATEQAKAEKEAKKTTEQEARLVGGEEVTPEKLKEVEQKVQKYVGGDVASWRLANLKTKDERLKARLQKISEARSFMKNGATHAMKQGAARMIRDSQREGFSALLGGHHGLADDAFDFGVAQACPDLMNRGEAIGAKVANADQVKAFDGTPEEAMLKLGRMTGPRGEKPEYLGKNSGVAVLNYFNCWVPPSEREETYVSQLQSGAGVA